MNNEYLIFLEEDNVLTCKNKNVKMVDVFLSLSKYAYFYGRSIVINGQYYVYEIPHIDDIKDGKVYPIKVYQRLTIKPIEVDKVEKNKMKSAGDWLDYFFELYEDTHLAPCEVDKTKMVGYKSKMRNIMDKIREAGFGDNEIKRYIKQHVLFGNYKGDIIYLNYLFHVNTINNYMVYLRGGKKITELWQNLDVALGSLEKGKIKYLMNLNNVESFNEEELKVCMKLYKIYNTVEFEKLKLKHKYTNNFYAKVKVFEMIMADEKVNDMEEMLIKCGHTKKYIQYEYIKDQLENSKKEN